MPIQELIAHDAFERLDVDSPGCDPVQVRLHTARYEFAQSWCAGKAGLDLACGTGYGTAMLAQSGATRMVGVDIDRATIERARQRFGLPSVSFVVGNAEDPPVAGPFDTIVSFETIEHLHRPERFLSAVSRLVEPSGHFIVSSPCRQEGSLRDRPRNPFHVCEWNRAEFAELLGRYFGRVVIFGQLIEFAKNRIPLNRTLARLVTSVFSPQRLQGLYSCSVHSLDNLPQFRMRIAYLVAVCSHPK
jgi:SAM-dependent methyltransferase